MAKNTKRKTELLDVAKAKASHDLLDHAVHNFRGQLDELESALGMYVIGRHFGWKVLYIIHSKRTIRRYEEILGIDVRAAFPEVGLDAERSLGFKAVSAVSNFWKVVSGEIKIDIDREERRSVG